MNIKTFIEITEECNAKELDIIKRKNSDYATDGSKEAFSNFKGSAEIVRAIFQRDEIPATAEVDVLFLIATKLLRIGSLLGSGKEPLNESMEDTIGDAINYFRIFRGILQEKSEKEASIKKEPTKEDEIITIYTTQASLEQKPDLIIEKNGTKKSIRQFGFHKVDNSNVKFCVVKQGLSYQKPEGK